MRHLTLFIALAFFSIACNEDIASGNRPYPGPTCVDRCPDEDVNFLRFVNNDNYIIYVKYGQSRDGSNFNLVSVSQVGNRGSLSMPFNNEGYNHYLFYKDPQRTAEIGRLIIKNTQPFLVQFCTVRLLHSGTFSTNEKKTTFQNQRLGAYVETYDMSSSLTNIYNLVDSRFSIPRCGNVTMPSTPSDIYRHMQFFDYANDTRGPILSSIVYRNTNSSQISLPFVMIR